ncbi:MAG TPA: ABC transporter permease, partial [Verrucomicrobiae bacterium]|nr:ABC transporter permease [Verrucomicrobiae bacterium]
MTNATLARRSLAFYARSHLGTIFGSAIATAVLVGALLVGDSVRGSLRQMALSRLGKIEYALASGDRLFRAALGAEVQAEASVGMAAVLQIPGTASNPTGSARAHGVQVNGVDQDFWAFAAAPPSGTINPGETWINARLASQLKTKIGETILIRVPRTSHLSRDAPLSPDEDSTVALRVQVSRVLNDEAFGRFGLAASQVPPMNAFVPLAFLQQKVNATNQANLLLAKTSSSNSLEHSFAKRFTLADAQLLFRPVPNRSELELRSPRVFLDAQIAAAALKMTNAQPVLTYFVN